MDNVAFGLDNFSLDFLLIFSGSAMQKFAKVVLFKKFRWGSAAALSAIYFSRSVTTNRRNYSRRAPPKFLKQYNFRHVTVVPKQTPIPTYTIPGPCLQRRLLFAP